MKSHFLSDLAQCLSGWHNQVLGGQEAHSAEDSFTTLPPLP